MKTHNVLSALVILLIATAAFTIAIQAVRNSPRTGERGAVTERALLCKAAGSTALEKMYVERIGTELWDVLYRSQQWDTLYEWCAVKEWEEIIQIAKELKEKRGKEAQGRKCDPQQVGSSELTELYIQHVGEDLWDALHRSQSWDTLYEWCAVKDWEELKIIARDIKRKKVLNTDVE